MPTAAEIVAALDERDAQAQATPAVPLPRPGLTRTFAVLTRFAAVFPHQALPERFDQLPLHQQMQLQDADPELALVLRGQMPAGLEAQVLSGAWPDVKPAPPSPAEQRAALVQELTAGGTVNPFLPGGNLSAQIRLAQVDPVVAEQLRLAAAPAHQAVQQQQAAEREQHRQQAIAEANANSLAEQQARARQHFGFDG